MWPKKWSEKLVVWQAKTGDPTNKIAGFSQQMLEIGAGNMRMGICLTICLTKIWYGFEANQSKLCLTTFETTLTFGCNQKPWKMSKFNPQNSNLDSRWSSVNFGLHHSCLTQACAVHRLRLLAKVPLLSRRLGMLGEQLLGMLWEVANPTGGLMTILW